MNDDRVFERAVDDWLADGSDQTPQPAVDGVLLAVKTTPQERDLRVPWRTSPMPLQLRLAAVIAVIAVAGLAAMMIYRPDPGPGNASPTPVTSPSPTSNLLDTSAWVAYTSERYGFDIKRPADWIETPSNHDWQLADAVEVPPAAGEHFFTQGLGETMGVGVSAWSVAVASGTSLDAWLQDYCATASGSACPGILDAAHAITVAGHPGFSIASPSTDSQIYSLIDDRVYVITAWRSDTDPATAPFGGGRRLVESYASTLVLRPGGPAPVASAPALAGSFTSDLYGYSMDFPTAFWTATPGTEVWVPGASVGDGWSDTFLPPSTANGFRAASAQIPDGVTPSDAWIGANITDTGGECNPPTSTLGTVAIDGLEGRVRFSCEEVEATVIVDGRIYLFTLFLDTGEPYSTAGSRALFEAMIATVQLTPETAVAPSPTPS